MTELMLEYDPAPPFGVGSPEKAGAGLVSKARLYAMGTLGLEIK